MSLVNAYLLIGSNLGDRFKLIKKAVEELSSLKKTKVLHKSCLYETEPWGVKNQNRFLNLAVEIQTELAPLDLLKNCQNIEQALGRNREKEIRWGERPIDIDIIFYGKEIIKEQNLIIPHLFMHERAFVLVPLIDLIPDFVHPILEKTISELYNELKTKEEVVICKETEVRK